MSAIGADQRAYRLAATVRENVYISARRHLEDERNIVTVRFDKHDSKLERRASASDANFSSDGR
jgi:hypothetical protein